MMSFRGGLRFGGRKPIGSLLVLFLGGTLFAACGSGEVSEDDYRAATGEVCAKYEKVINLDRRQVARLAERSGDDPEQFVDVVRTFERDWDEFAATLKAVERPPADEQELDRFFAAVTESQDRIADLTTEVDALPALTRQVKEVQASQDPAAAEALVERAERIQKDIRKAEAGFDEAIGKVERFVNRYPGLADCR